MSGNPLVKKFVQITEESLPPVYVGNNFYVLMQQDIRKIEDTRFLAVSKLLPNGDFMPIDGAAVDLLLQLMRMGNLNIILNHDEPMDVSPPSKYCIEQQLKWDKCTNTSFPRWFLLYPLDNSSGKDVVSTS
uniref:Uncharacterized protein n=1 Tax=Stomoxys calcitrans TaxID=35570 RepID=A0A1I8Q1W0_STOCA